MEVRDKDGLVQHLAGFPVGGVLLSKETDRELGYALNNHLDFTIYLNDKEIRDVNTVVGFDITPRRYVYHANFLFPFIFYRYNLMISIRYSSREEVATYCNSHHFPVMQIRDKYPIGHQTNVY